MVFYVSTSLKLVTSHVSISPLSRLDCWSAEVLKWVDRRAPSVRDWLRLISLQRSHSHQRFSILTSRHLRVDTRDIDFVCIYYNVPTACILI